MNVRQAEDSHHGIPDELFGPPAQRGQLIDAASKNLPSTSRERSASSRCPSPVESTRSANRT